MRGGNHFRKSVLSHAAKDLTELFVIVDTDNADRVFERKIFGVDYKRVASGKSGQDIAVGRIINILNDGDSNAEHGGGKEDRQSEGSNE